MNGPKFRSNFVNNVRNLLTAQGGHKKKTGADNNYKLICVLFVTMTVTLTWFDASLDLIVTLLCAARVVCRQRQW